MKPKERFISTLNGGIPDMVPLFDYLYSKRLYKEVLGIEVTNYDNLNALSLAETLEHDGVYVMSGLPKNYKLQVISDSEFIDEWGTTWKTNDSSWPFGSPVNYSIKNADDLKSFKIPDPGDESRYYPIRESIENNKKSIAIIGGVGGPFTVAAVMIGYERFSIISIENKSFISELFEIITEYGLNQIDMLKKIGVDVINIADDLGYDSGTFFNPIWYEEYLFPFLKLLVDQAKKNKLPVFLHSDGNLNSIIGSLIDLGFNGLNPIERKADMNIKKIREKYGNKLCLIGNVDSSKTLVFGSTEEVEKETLQCIKDAAASGAHILASDHSFHSDIPTDNIYKMVEARAKYGRYPINL